MVRIQAAITIVDDSTSGVVVKILVNIVVIVSSDVGILVCICILILVLVVIEIPIQILVNVEDIVCFRWRAWHSRWLVPA